MGRGDMHLYLLLAILLLAGSPLGAPVTWAAPGDLVWQDRFDLTGGPDSPTSLAVEGGAVFVAGNGATAAGHLDWLVRAYDARSGASRWQDQHDGTGRFDAAGAIAAKGGRVFVGGATTNAAGNRDALVRAYDARSGTLLWQDQFNRAGRLDEVSFQTMAVEGARLFVGGRAGQANGNADWFVQGHDAVTGARLWQDFFDGASFDHTVTLAAQGDLVVAGGVTTDASITRHFTVRAHDAATGALRWHHQAATGMVGFFFATDVAWRVAVHGDRVVAAGSMADATGIHLAVRVLDAGTGAILWEDLVDTGAGSDVAFALAVAGGRAIVGGGGGTACSAFVAADCDWVIRAYDLETGALAWAKQVDGAGFDDQVSDLAAQGDRVVVAGVVGNATGGLDWRVQAYDVETGALLWEDLVVEPGGLAFPNTVVLHGDQAFLAGVAGDPAGNTDWLVRVHELR